MASLLSPLRVGAAITRQRTERGVSQSQLARQLHVTPSRVWQLEAAYRGCYPSLSTLARIAKILQCSVSMLLLRAETKI
jgi:transcriptional regulator with XRE-family HTH domain